MKKYIKSTCVILLFIISQSLSAQLQTAAVVSVYTQGLKLVLIWQKVFLEW